MKEYRIKPENLNQIAKAIVIRGLTMVVISCVVLVPILYYMPQRGESYVTWSDYFANSPIKFILFGIVGFSIVLIPISVVTSKKLYASLVVMVHDDRISWTSANKEEQSILFSDMYKIGGRIGITIKSKSNKRLQLLIPKQTEGYSEIESAILTNLVKH